MLENDIGSPFSTDFWLNFDLFFLLYASRSHGFCNFWQYTFRSSQKIFASLAIARESMKKLVFRFRSRSSMAISLYFMLETI